MRPPTPTPTLHAGMGDTDLLIPLPCAVDPDNDECQDEEAEACVGGRCVNTVGSYYCSCQAPLVLDASQRRCVANDSQALGEPRRAARTYGVMRVHSGTRPAHRDRGFPPPQMPTRPCAGRRSAPTWCAAARAWTGRSPTPSAAASMARPGAWIAPSAPTATPVRPPLPRPTPQDMGTPRPRSHGLGRTRTQGCGA